jgi:hypothetical protein
LRTVSALLLQEMLRRVLLLHSVPSQALPEGNDGLSEIQDLPAVGLPSPGRLDHDVLLKYTIPRHQFLDPRNEAMPSQSSLINRAALCALLLISAMVSSAHADDYCPEGGGHWWSGWGSRCKAAWNSGGNSGGNSGANSGWRGGSGGLYTQQNYYYDARDTRLYSAQKYNVPVTVPVAPIVRTYNYGWGIPSARLSPIGGYTAWYPDVPFTQYGGRLPGGIYPVIYQPTDTTQLGYYYNYVPSWQPRSIP